MLIRSKAPLRLGFAGGGTDIAAYYNQFGGYVLNATIDRYAFCTIEPDERAKVLFNAADLGVCEEFDAKSELPTDNKLKLHTGIYNRIVHDFCGGNALSFKMTTYSDAPMGSGLGASSTMVVAIIKAFCEWLNLPLGDYDIAFLACKIERDDLKLAGGKQDQYAATFGGFNFMEFDKDEKVIVNPLRLKLWMRNELQASLVLYYTGVSRESANIIQHQIDNTKNNDAKSIENMHELKKLAVLMKEALLKGDFKTFAECLGRGWHTKKGIASHISNSFIDEIYQYALESGAISAKISGAGGGGFMMFYCNPCDRIKLVNALKQKSGIVETVSFADIGATAWIIR